MKSSRTRFDGRWPEAFDLNKYQPCDAFTLRDWLPNLEFRAYTNFCLLSKDRRNRANAFIESALHQPILPSNLSAKRYPHLNKSGSREQVVADLDAMDYFGSKFDLDDKRLSKYVDALDRENYNKASDEDRSLLKTPVWKMFQDVGYAFEYNFNVNVNLACTEERAIADFIEWFRTTKRAAGIANRERAIKEEEARTWAKHKILAYMDLRLWAMANELDVTNQQYGAVLFPSEFEVSLSERMRKTVEPIRREIVNETFCDMLRLQVESAIRELTPDDTRMLPGKYEFVGPNGPLRGENEE